MTQTQTTWQDDVISLLRSLDTDDALNTLNRLFARASLIKTHDVIGDDPAKFYNVIGEVLLTVAENSNGHE
jgi:hypothetical protein